MKWWLFERRSGYDTRCMIRSPLLIIGCPRSGTTLLYNILSEVTALWTIGYESKAIIERYHGPENKAWESGELTAADLTDISRDYILRQFEAQAAAGSYWRRVNDVRRFVNHNARYRSMKKRGRTVEKGSEISSALPGRGLELFRAAVRLNNRLHSSNRSIRLLEKTPENCLRLPFLGALFPDARVIFLTREGRANVHSLMEGWRHPHLFPGYRTPVPVTSPGLTRERWAFTLVPGWRDLVNSPLEEICARQWVACNEAVLNYVGTPEALPVLTIRYEDLVAVPDTVLERIADFAGLSVDEIPAYGQNLPEVNAVSTPGVDKWRAEGGAINRIMPMILPVMRRLGYDERDFVNTAS